MKILILNMSLKQMITDEEFIEKNKKILETISELKNKLIKLETNKETPSYYENIANNIKKIITPKLNIKENIGKYFNLFIDKVFVSKINNDRKHLKLQMIFNFKTPDQEMELDYNKKDNNNSNMNNKDEKTKTKITNRDYSLRLSFDNNFLRQKYLLLDTKEPRFCCPRSKTWEKHII